MSFFEIKFLMNVKVYIYIEIKFLLVHNVSVLKTKKVSIC